MGTLRRHFPQTHKCELEEEQHELPRVAPYANPFRKFIYGMRRWILISRWHYDSNFYFRSKHGVYKEKRRQVIKYKWIIHPFSRFCIIEERVMCLMWMLSFMLEPYMASFQSNYVRRANRVTLIHLTLMMNFIYAIHITLSFITGYPIDKSKEIVLDKKMIFKKYITSYFVFDFTSTSYCFILFAFRNSHWYKPISLFPLQILRCARLKTMLDYMRNFLSLLNIKIALSRCFTMGIFTLFQLHWLACLFYFIPCVAYYREYKAYTYNSWVIKSAFNPMNTNFQIYIHCLLSTVCHFFGCGKGSIDTKNALEQLILAMMLMGGVTCHIYVIAVILQLFGAINISESKFEELIYQLNDYMVTKRLPPNLRKRIFMYYEYRYQKQFFMESVILNSLSEHLRFEIVLYSCRNLIDKVKIFQGASKSVIGSIISMLRHEIYLPEDMIIKPDTVNEFVYFVAFGTCAIYLPGGKEVIHLEDGHHFGELHIILQNIGRKSFTTAKAIEIMEVYYLTSKHFLFCVEAHPEIAARLETVALARLNAYRIQMLEMGRGSIDPSDILAELRKGRILDEKKRRY